MKCSPTFYGSLGFIIIINKASSLDDYHRGNVKVNVCDSIIVLQSLHSIDIPFNYPFILGTFLHMTYEFITLNRLLTLWSLQEIS